MSWTEGEFYRFYTDKEIKNVYKKITDIVENKLKFKYEYTEFNDEKNLFFYKNNKMLNSHLKKGYHLNKNGEGCFGLEGKRVTMNQVVSLYKFDGLSDFEPYDINLVFEKAYYYLLVLPEPIETSKFSKEIFDLFSDALNSK